MKAPFVSCVKLDSFLSFAPDTPSTTLEGLNVIIGPNASGKSNLLEAFELLKATPTDFAAAMRDGGGAAEWLWKGSDNNAPTATLAVELGKNSSTPYPLRYRLAFASVNGRTEVIDEAIEETMPRNNNLRDVFFYYRFQNGHPAINARNLGNGKQRIERKLERASLAPDQSVLAQRKDPDLYPEVTWVGRQFGAIQIFREWTFGRYGALRQPQPADLPETSLLPDSRNLALLLNQIEHRDGRQFNVLLKRFFPRFERMSTRVSGGTVQFYLHEAGFSSPIPATRLSDGTMRFVALLATLLAPEPPPLVCIEEPELGLHPDAMAIIAEILLDASHRMQLIVTTHSDALVSALSEYPKTVVTCERIGGSTKLSRLDPEHLSYWLEKYRLGDLWRMGELGANP